MDTERRGGPQPAESIAEVRTRIDRRIGPLAVGWDPSASAAARREALGHELVRVLVQAGVAGRLQRREADEIVLQVHEQMVRLRLDTVDRRTDPPDTDGVSPPHPAERLRLSIVDPAWAPAERVGWSDDGRPLEARLREIAVEVVTRAEIRDRDTERDLFEWRADDSERPSLLGPRNDGSGETWMGRPAADHDDALLRWDGEGGAG